MYHTSLESIFQSKDILRTLDRVSDNEARTICLIPFGSVHNIFKKLTEKTFPSRIIKEIKVKRNIGLYNLEIYARKDGALTVDGKFIVYRMPEFEYCYLLIALDDTEFFHRQLRSLVTLFYNEIVLSFIKSNDLINLIENYQSTNNISEIIITRATQKIRYHGESRMTTVTWNNSSLEEAYEWLRENNGFFKSVQFKAMRLEKEVTNSFVDRRGTMRIDKNFSKLFQSFVIPNFTLLDKYIKLFNNRGRRDNKLLDVNPLAINFDNDLFEDKANHIRFIEMLAELSDTSVSVIHGNPYIHVSIMDYVDGSTYDLWVLNWKQILIVPQLRSSIISLKRIVNHIFDYYAEGEIRNYDK